MCKAVQKLSVLLLNHQRNRTIWTNAWLIKRTKVITIAVNKMYLRQSMELIIYTHQRSFFWIGTFGECWCLGQVTRLKRPSKTSWWFPCNDYLRTQRVLSNDRKQKHAQFKLKEPKPEIILLDSQQNVSCTTDPALRQSKSTNFFEGVENLLLRPFFFPAFPRQPPLFVLAAFWVSGVARMRENWREWLTQDAQLQSAATAPVPQSYCA